MSGSGRLQPDPLFQGLARPVMIMGVSYLYFVFNALFCLITFINTNDFLVLLVVMPSIHLFGYMLCLREPRAVELAALRLKLGNKSWNNLLGYHYHTNSYDVF
jgi:type IV secretory pathway VirB3-like protein